MFASPAHDCRAGLSQQERHTCNASLSRRHTPLGWCGKCPAYATAVASARPCRAVRQEYMASAVQAFIINNRLSHQAPSAQRRTHAVRPSPALTASVAFFFQAEMADSGTTHHFSPHSMPISPLPTRRPTGQDQAIIGRRLVSGSTRLSDDPTVDYRRMYARDALVTVQSLELCTASITSCLADTR